MKTKRKFISRDRYDYYIDDVHVGTIEYSDGHCEWQWWLVSNTTASVRNGTGSNIRDCERQINLWHTR